MPPDAVLYAALRAKIAARFPDLKLPDLGPDWRALATWYVVRVDRRQAPLKYLWVWVTNNESLRLRKGGMLAAIDTWLHGHVEPDRLAELAQGVGDDMPIVRLLLYVSRARSGSLWTHPAFADVYAVIRDQKRP